MNLILAGNDTYSVSLAEVPTAFAVPEVVHPSCWAFDWVQGLHITKIKNGKSLNKKA